MVLCICILYLIYVFLSYHFRSSHVLLGRRNGIEKQNSEVLSYQINILLVQSLVKSLLRVMMKNLHLELFVLKENRSCISTIPKMYPNTHKKEIHNTYCMCAFFFCCLDIVYSLQWYKSLRYISHEESFMFIEKAQSIVSSFLLHLLVPRLFSHFLE